MTVVLRMFVCKCVCVPLCVSLTKSSLTLCIAPRHRAPLRGALQMNRVSQSRPKNRAEVLQYFQV
jgi:hypothetical protein